MGKIFRLAMGGDWDGVAAEADEQLDAIRERLDALEAKAQPLGHCRDGQWVLGNPPYNAKPAPATIAVPVKTLMRWQVMVADVALDIEMDEKADLRWIYRVGQAYSDAHVVAGEMTDLLREVGGEP